MHVFFTQPHPKWYNSWTHMNLHSFNLWQTILFCFQPSINIRPVLWSLFYFNTTKIIHNLFRTSRDWKFPCTGRIARALKIVFWIQKEAPPRSCTKFLMVKIKTEVLMFLIVFDLLFQMQGKSRRSISNKVRNALVDLIWWFSEIGREQVKYYQKH